MYKFMLTIVLALVSTNVFSEWQLTKDSALTTTYIDPKSVERYGHVAKMPLLTIFKEEYFRLFPKRKWHSRLTMIEYNCVQNTFRPTKITNYSKNKNIISSNDKLNINWAHISDDENWAKKRPLEIACKGIK